MNDEVNTEVLSEEERAAKKPKKRLNPARYGDWEHKGRCIDF